MNHLHRLPVWAWHHCHYCGASVTQAAELAVPNGWRCSDLAACLADSRVRSTQAGSILRALAS